MSVDNSELMAFQNQIQALKDDIPEIMDSLAVGEGRYARDQARKICKEENIVNTGDYRRNFKSGTKAIRAGNSYKIDVFNNLDYAKPLEYGFRSHFVPGHWEGNSFKYQRRRNARRTGRRLCSRSFHPSARYKTHEDNPGGTTEPKNGSDHSSTHEWGWHRMTLNNFLEAVAEKLVGLWPDRHVFVNEIPKDSDGNFFVRIIEATQEKKLDRRRRRHVQIEVLYFLASKDNLDFNEWSEKMLDEFESLTVVETESRSRLVRLTNVTARKDDDSRVYQFLFDADFYFVITPEVIPTMYYLDQDNTIRSEVIE